MIYIVILIIIICFIAIHFKKDNERKSKEQSITQQRQQNLNLLIEDVIQTIDKNAPNFKYIYLGCEKSTIAYSSDRVRIIDYNNKVLHYDYIQHGFSPSQDAKRQLAQAISQKYDGKFFEKKRDASWDERPYWVTDYYEVIAHDGLKEMDELQRKNDSIKRC